MYKNIVLLLGGFLLLALCFFRAESFASNLFTEYLFFAFKIAGTILFAWAFWSFFFKSIKVKVALIIFIEALLYFAYQNSISISHRVVQIFRYPTLKSILLPIANELHQYSVRYYNNTLGYIQFDPKSSIYDKDLFYKLKEGDFGFETVEFTSHFKVNSFGVRDDEKSLTNPKIIFIGDSFTMGWGVNQNETYESLVEDSLKVRCLNAGISSYGTARESVMLQKVDKDSCEVLVLQYCDNDFEENESFITKNKLEVSTESVFKQKQRTVRLLSTKTPFINTFQLIDYLFVSKMINTINTPKPTTQQPKNQPSKKNEIEVFMLTLDRISANFDKPIIILNLNPFITNTEFYEQLSQQIQKRNLSNIYLINTSHFINQYYYKFGLHITKAGHRQVASAIIKTIRENNLIR